MPAPNRPPQRRGTRGPLALLVLAAGCGWAQTPAPPPQSSAADRPAYSNRLAGAHSPYLLLHADNPVDWYPWGEAAFARARAEDKPIFLSVGYSTCYWCHVAEETIYSNPAIAALMNAWFVNVKVDREELPDVDAIYMLATQLLTGRGGWPNNLFLTPAHEPFFAGSYFPPEDSAERGPGFLTVLKRLHESWAGDRERVNAVARQVAAAMRRASATAGARTPPAQVEPGELIGQARERLAATYDPGLGGFIGGGTKFPMPPTLELLFADYRLNHNSHGLEMATRQLDAMALGGIYDQIGGGFHRYSTEATWSIPHFEKMLYDNAQLLALYSRAYAITGRPLYRRIAEGVADFLQREMADPEGGLYTAQDAAIDGREGVHYLWTRAQIETVLGADRTERFLDLYELVQLPAPTAGPEAGAPSAGAVLRVLSPFVGPARPPDAQLIESLDALAPLRRRLLSARESRPQAPIDRKIVAGLNGLAIRGLVASATVLDRPQDLALARRAAERLWREAFDPQSGELKHQLFRGRAPTPGYLEDYAHLARACLDLAQAAGEPRWTRRAQRLTDAMIERFVHDDTLVTTQNRHLLIQPPLEGDGVLPSPVSATLELLYAMARQPGHKPYGELADHLLARLSGALAGYPEGWGALLATLAENGQGTSLASVVPSDSRRHVHIDALGVRLADREEVHVRFEIEAGYHLNANPASFDYLIPTSVQIAGAAPLRVRYPVGQAFRAAFARSELSVYEGEVEVVAELAPGMLDHADRVQAQVQACTDRICLPPSRVDVPIHAPAAAGAN